MDSEDDVGRVREFKWYDPIDTLFLFGIVVLWCLIFTCGNFAYQWFFRGHSCGEAAKNFLGPRGACNSSFRAWAVFVTRCPCIVFLIGLAIPGYLSYRGLSISGWDMVIDMDFKNYVREESDIRFMQDAFEAKIDEQKLTMSESSNGRRLSKLKPQRAPFWNLDVYFEAVDKSKGIFSPDALKEIRRFQESVTAHDSYEKFCYKYPRDECWKPAFFWDWTALKEPRIHEWPPGEASDNQYKDEAKTTLQFLIDEGTTWWLDKGFDYGRLRGDVTRTTFRGGIPLSDNDGFINNWREQIPEDEKKHEEWLKSLYEEVLKKIDSDTYKHVLITWDESKFLKSYETLDILKHDLTWSTGSILSVTVLIALQTKRIVVTGIVLVCVGLSFSTTYYFYYAVLDYPKMTVLNFVSAFLVIGIAADDVLVLNAAYVFAASQSNNLRTNHRLVMRKAYHKAAEAMLVTTVTTCGSFYSLVVSSLPIVRSFGWFMGTLLVWNYITCMILLPTGILLADEVVACVRRRCCWSNAVQDIVELGRSGRASFVENDRRSGQSFELMKKAMEGDLADKLFGSTGSMKSDLSAAEDDGPGKGVWGSTFLATRGLQCMDCCKWCFVPMMICIAAVSTYLWISSFKLATEKLQVFRASQNLGRVDFFTEEAFATYDIIFLDEQLDRLSGKSASEAARRSKCPGDGDCFGKGRCDFDTGYTCQCDAEYKGIACFFPAEPGTIALSSEIIGAGIYLDPSNSPANACDIISARSEELESCSKTLTLTNEGDDAVEFDLVPVGVTDSQKWLRISHWSGTVPPRQHITETVWIPGNFTVSTSSVFDTFANGVWKHAEFAVRKNQENTGVEFKVVQGVANYPFIWNVIKVHQKIGYQPDSQVNAIKEVDASQFVSIGAPTETNYSLKYPGVLSLLNNVTEIQLEVDWPLNLVEKVTVNGTEMDTGVNQQNGAVKSASFDIPQPRNGAATFLTIEVEAKQFPVWYRDAKFVTTYLMHISRVAILPKPPELLYILAGQGALNVHYKKPTFSEGENVAEPYSYEIRVIPVGDAGGRRLQTDQIVFPIDSCSNNCDSSLIKLSEVPLSECCGATVTGLDETVFYTVAIAAKNADGVGPTSTQNTYPFVPLKPVAPPPAGTSSTISLQPLVCAYDGYVELVVSWRSLNPAGAIPVGNLICTSDPGAISSSTSYGEVSVVIGGLDPSILYTFKCSTTNHIGRAIETLTTDPLRPKRFVPPLPSVMDLTFSQRRKIDVAAALDQTDFEIAVCVGISSSSSLPPDRIDLVVTSYLEGIVINTPFLIGSGRHVDSATGEVTVSMEEDQGVLPARASYNISCKTRTVGSCGDYLDSDWSSMAIVTIPDIPKLQALEDEASRQSITFQLSDLQENANITCFAKFIGLMRQGALLQINYVQTVVVELSSTELKANTRGIFYGLQIGALYKIQCKATLKVVGTPRGTVESDLSEEIETETLQPTTTNSTSFTNTSTTVNPSTTTTNVTTTTSTTNTTTLTNISSTMIILRTSTTNSTTSSNWTIRFTTTTNTTTSTNTSMGHSTMALSRTANTTTNVTTPSTSVMFASTTNTTPTTTNLTRISSITHTSTNTTSTSTSNTTVYTTSNRTSSFPDKVTSTNTTITTNTTTTTTLKTNKTTTTTTRNTTIIPTTSKTNTTTTTTTKNTTSLSATTTTKSSNTTTTANTTTTTMTTTMTTNTTTMLTTTATLSNASKTSSNTTTTTTSKTNTTTTASLANTNTTTTLKTNTTTTTTTKNTKNTTTLSTTTTRLSNTTTTANTTTTTMTATTTSNTTETTTLKTNITKTTTTTNTTTMVIFSSSNQTTTTTNITTTTTMKTNITTTATTKNTTMAATTTTTISANTTTTTNTTLKVATTTTTTTNTTTTTTTTTTNTTTTTTTTTTNTTITTNTTTVINMTSWSPNARRLSERRLTSIHTSIDIVCVRPLQDGFDLIVEVSGSWKSGSVQCYPQSEAPVLLPMTTAVRGSSLVEIRVQSMTLERTLRLCCRALDGHDRITNESCSQEVSSGIAYQNVVQLTWPTLALNSEALRDVIFNIFQEKSALAATEQLRQTFEVRKSEIVINGAIQEPNQNESKCNFSNANGVHDLIGPDQYRIQVTMKDDQDSRLFERYLFDAESLTGWMQGADLSALRMRTGATSAKLITRPTLDAASFSDSSLKDLKISSEGHLQVLVPPFEPTIHNYTVNLTGLTYEIDAQASSAIAYSIKVDDLFDVPTISTVTKAGHVRTAKLMIMAKSYASSLYVVDLFYTERNCSSLSFLSNCSGHGKCDTLTGGCACDSGYAGASCQAECPNDCSGHGACNFIGASDQLGCNCDKTYSGIDCTVRECACQNGGNCSNQPQDWSCACPNRYRGEFCEERYCAIDGNGEVCNGRGYCNALGECECDPGFAGESCEPADTPDAIASVVEVSLVWGITDYDKDNTSRALMNKDFDFYGDGTLLWMKTVVEAAREANESLKVQDHTAQGSVSGQQDDDKKDLTFPEEFLEFMDSARGKNSLRNDTLTIFFSERARKWKFWSHVGTLKTQHTGNVTWARAVIRLNLRKSAGAQNLEPVYKNWVEFVDTWNSKAEGERRPGWSMIMVSESWTQMTAELNVLDTTLQSFAISIGITSFVVLISTGNWVLMLYTTVTIVFTVTTLFGFLLQVVKWEFGAIQAMALVFFVGLSVDFCLHVNHHYNTATKHNLRKAKVKDVLQEVGMAVIGGACTTVVATVFLFPCQVELFVQLGTMMCANMSLALLYTFLFLCPLLLLLGPLDKCGRVMIPPRELKTCSGWKNCCCIRNKKRFFGDDKGYDDDFIELTAAEKQSLEDKLNQREALVKRVFEMYDETGDGILEEVDMKKFARAMELPLLSEKAEMQDTDPNFVWSLTYQQLCEQFGDDVGLEGGLPLMDLAAFLKFNEFNASTNEELNQALLREQDTVILRFCIANPFLFEYDKESGLIQRSTKPNGVEDDGYPQVGWRIVLVQGKRYSPELLEEYMKGDEDFEMTFNQAIYQTDLFDLADFQAVVDKANYEYWSIELKKTTRKSKLGIAVDIGSDPRMLKVKRINKGRLIRKKGMIQIFNEQIKTESRKAQNVRPGDDIVAIEAIFGHGERMKEKLATIEKDRPFKLTIRRKKVEETLQLKKGKKRKELDKDKRTERMDQEVESWMEEIKKKLRHLQVSVKVEGAGGTKGQHLNGHYEECGLHENRRKFKQMNGPCIIYYSDERWKMSHTGSIEDGHCYEVPWHEDARLPPEGPLIWKRPNEDSLKKLSSKLSTHDFESPPIIALETKALRNGEIQESLGSDQEDDDDGVYNQDKRARNTVQSAESIESVDSERDDSFDHEEEVESEDDFSHGEKVLVRQCDGKWCGATIRQTPSRFSQMVDVVYDEDSVIEESRKHQLELRKARACPKGHCLRPHTTIADDYADTICKICKEKKFKLPIDQVFRCEHCEYDCCTECFAGIRPGQAVIDTDSKVHILPVHPDTLAKALEMVGYAWNPELNYMIGGADYQVSAVSGNMVKLTNEKAKDEGMIGLVPVPLQYVVVATQVIHDSSKIKHEETQPTSEPAFGIKGNSVAMIFTLNNVIYTNLHDDLALEFDFKSAFKKAIVTEAGPDNHAKDVDIEIFPKPNKSRETVLVRAVVHNSTNPGSLFAMSTSRKLMKRVQGKLTQVVGSGRAFDGKFRLQDVQGHLLEAAILPMIFVMKNVNYEVLVRSRRAHEEFRCEVKQVLAKASAVLPDDVDMSILSGVGSAKCCIPGCVRPSWNGEPNQPCCITCNWHDGAKHDHDCDRNWSTMQQVVIRAVVHHVSDPHQAVVAISDPSKRIPTQLKNAVKNANAHCGDCFITTGLEPEVVGDINVRVQKAFTMDKITKEKEVDDIAEELRKLLIQSLLSGEAKKLTQEHKYEKASFFQWPVKLKKARKSSHLGIEVEHIGGCTLKVLDVKTRDGSDALSKLGNKEGYYPIEEHNLNAARETQPLRAGDLIVAVDGNRKKDDMFRKIQDVGTGKVCTLDVRRYETCDIQYKLKSALERALQNGRLAEQVEIPQDLPSIACRETMGVVEREGAKELKKRHGDMLPSYGTDAETWILGGNLLSANRGSQILAEFKRLCDEDKNKYYAACIGFKECMEQRTRITKNGEADVQLATSRILSDLVRDGILVSEDGSYRPRSDSKSLGFGKAVADPGTEIELDDVMLSVEDSFGRSSQNTGATRLQGLQAEEWIYGSDLLSSGKGLQILEQVKSKRNLNENEYYAVCTAIREALQKEQASEDRKMLDWHLPWSTAFAVARLESDLRGLSMEEARERRRDEDDPVYEEWTVDMKGTNEVLPLGFEVAYNGRLEPTLKVARVDERMFRLATQDSLDKRILPGDHIVAVDGVFGDEEIMKRTRRIKAHTEFQLIVRRYKAKFDQWVVTLTKTRELPKLGIDIARVQEDGQPVEKGSLEVKMVKKGIVREYNARLPKDEQDKRMRAGDRIIAVNGVFFDENDIFLTVKEMEEGNSFELVLRRYCDAERDI